jgi:uncharacterized membrane protein YeaQ/YmgE (transglycosylase-associated protein family)
LEKKERKEEQMNVEQLLVFLLIGGVAGWLAGLIMKGDGFGIVGNIIIGVIGAFLGGWIFGMLGISVGGKWVWPIVTATAGAVVLLFIIGLIRKK